MATNKPPGPDRGDADDRREAAALDAAERAWRSPTDSVVVERPIFTGYPFTLGVASGSPLPTGVVLWTRLAPEPLNGGGVGSNAVRVLWEVADDSYADPERRTRFTAGAWRQVDNGLAELGV